MLILTRRPGELLTLDLQDWASPEMTAQELFGHEGISVCIRRVLRNEVRIGIQAPDAVRILREELLPINRRYLD